MAASEPSSETPSRPAIAEAPMRLAVEASTDCIKVLALDGPLEYMNEGGMCVMEIEDFGAFQGACWPDFWQGEENAKANAALDRARAGGVGRFQGYTATAKGNVRYWDVTVSPVTGPDGRPERLLSVSRDVTAQKEDERERERLLGELRAERERAEQASRLLRLVSDRLPVRVAYVDREYRYRFLNGEYARFYGHDVDGALGEPIAALAGDAAFDAARPYLDRALSGEANSQTLEVPYPFGRVWVEVSFEPDLGEDGVARGVVVHAADVTERRDAEAERERLNAELEVERGRLRTMFAQAPAIIAVLRGPELRFEYVNEGYRQLTGHRPMIGLTISEALPEATGGGEGKDYDRVLRRVYEGERLAFAARPVTLQPTPGAEPEERFLDLAYLPLAEADGGVDGVLVHGVDVTDQVAARRELADANDRLEARVAERTEDLQRAVREAEGFNYSISHDLRSSLRAMASTSSILLEELGPELGDEHRELLQRQAHNANRMGRLIDELLRLSRFARVEVKRTRADMTAKFRRLFGELADQGRTNGCALDAQEGMAADADLDLVRTVVHNLLGNACKFSPQGGTIRVRQEGGVFSVSDEGVGFDVAHAARMFLPFERLVRDEEFEGTGIGLANVKRIVERHGGRVWAEGEPGRGATFFFTLG